MCSEMGGVDGLVYTNTAPLMRSPLSVSISTHKGLYVQSRHACAVLGEARVQGSRVEGVHGGWDRRGTTAALWVLRVSGSIRLA